MNKLQLLCIAKEKKWVTMYRRDGTGAMDRIQNLVAKKKVLLVN